MVLEDPSSEKSGDLLLLLRSRSRASCLSRNLCRTPWIMSGSFQCRRRPAPDTRAGPALLQSAMAQGSRPRLEVDLASVTRTPASILASDQLLAFLVCCSWYLPPPVTGKTAAAHWSTIACVAHYACLLRVTGLQCKYVLTADDVDAGTAGRHSVIVSAPPTPGH